VKHRQPDPNGADPEPGAVPGIAQHPSAIPTGSRVLLLNATFEPLAVVTAKRAIVLMLTGKAECVEVTLEGDSLRGAATARSSSGSRKPPGRGSPVLASTTVPSIRPVVWASATLADSETNSINRKESSDLFMGLSM
jgi:hypothetical protein